MSYPIDQQKCTSVVAEHDFLNDIDEEAGKPFGETYTAQDWRGLEKDLREEFKLNPAEMTVVLAALKKPFQTPSSSPASPVSTTTAASPAISPAETPEEDWIPDPDLPGYASDRYLRLKVVEGGKGRKVGKILTLHREWVNKAPKGAKKKFQFRIYYKVTIAGKRKTVPYYQVGINRTRAEGKRRYGS